MTLYNSVVPASHQAQEEEETFSIASAAEPSSRLKAHSTLRYHPHTRGDAFQYMGGSNTQVGEDTFITVPACAAECTFRAISRLSSGQPMLGPSRLSSWRS